MNRLSEGKLTTTMKEALIRNNIAEQKMKTSLHSLHSVIKKQVNTLQYKKAFYEKRQAELKRSLAVDLDSEEKISLHRGMPPRSASPAGHDRSRSSSPRPGLRYDRSRSPSPRPDSKSRPGTSIIRKISEPASFTSVIELHSNRSKVHIRPKSISLINAPSIEISVVEDQDSHEIKLPTISSSNQGLTTEIPCQQRRKSTGRLAQESGQSGQDLKSLRPSTPSWPRLLTPDPAGIRNGTRSAPSSPVLTRRGINMPGTPLPRNIPRSRIKSDEMRELTGILGILQDVRQKNVPDLDSVDMRDSRSMDKKANLPEIVPATGERCHDAVQNEVKDRDARPALEEDKMVKEDLSSKDNAPDVDDLASSMNKLRFCKYLRGNTVALKDEEHLPEELIPSSLIMGHTKVALYQ